MWGSLILVAVVVGGVWCWFPRGRGWGRASLARLASRPGSTGAADRPRTPSGGSGTLLVRDPGGGRTGRGWRRQAAGCQWGGHRAAGRGLPTPGGFLSGTWCRNRRSAAGRTPGSVVLTSVGLFVLRGTLVRWPGRCAEGWAVWWRGGVRLPDPRLMLEGGVGARY